MNPNEFFTTCEKAFAGLPAQYGFSEAEPIKRQFKWEWILKNTTTGIRVIYEVRELYVWILICQLVNDKIERRTGEMRSDTSISCFNLEDILSLRKKDDLSCFYDVVNVANYNLLDILQQYVLDLEEYGDDVLQGDFDVFRSLDVIVKHRAREAAFQKWGERAHEFGW